MFSLSRRIRQHAELKDRRAKMLDWQRRGPFRRVYKRGRPQRRNKQIWSLGKVWRTEKGFGKTANVGVSQCIVIGRDNEQWIYFVFAAIDLIYGVLVVLVHFATKWSLRQFTEALEGV